MSNKCIVCFIVFIDAENIRFEKNNLVSIQLLTIYDNFSDLMVAILNFA